MNKTLSTLAVAAFIHQSNLSVMFQMSDVCTMTDLYTDLTEMFDLPDTLVEMVETNMVDLWDYPDERFDPALLHEWLKLH